MSLGCQTAALQFPVMTPCLSRSGRPTPASLLLLVLLVLAGCAGNGQELTDATPAELPTDPQLNAEVTASFITYRAAVTRGDADAAMAHVTSESLDDQARVVELARSADEETVRQLPAAEQLLVLTYRLRPQLLEAEDPYAALVDAGLAGQDRSLGELGDISRVNEDLAVAEVLSNGTLEPTSLRWRFHLEDNRWRFDLADAQRLVSQAVANSARLSNASVEQVVTATIVDLSGEDVETVRELYSEPPV